MHAPRFRNSLVGILLMWFSLPIISAQTSISAPDLTKPAIDSAANSAQAKYVLQRTINALGGNQYLNVTEIKILGRGYGFYHNESQSVGNKFTRYIRFPDRERFEYNFQRDDYQVIRPESWFVIHIGDTGWETTFKGTRILTEKENEDYDRRRQYELDMVLRKWVPDPKTTFFYEGQTIEATREVYKVTLLSPQNLNVTLYVDRKTFLPIKKTFKYRDKVFKDIQEESELYDKYRDEQGLMTPHVYTRTMNGEITSERFVQSVIYNPGFDDRLFTPHAIDYDKMKKY